MNTNVDQALRSVQHTNNGDHALFVIPHVRGSGFQANIRGHILHLADPDSGQSLAPTPDDLLVASLASELAWSARMFLRADGLPDDVSVSATWRTHDDPPSLADINLTVTVSSRAEAVGAALAAALEKSLGARSHAKPIVSIPFEGVNR